MDEEQDAGIIQDLNPEKNVGIGGRGMIPSIYQPFLEAITGNGRQMFALTPDKHGRSSVLRFYRQVSRKPGRGTPETPDFLIG